MRIYDERHMQIIGVRQAQQPLQINLPWRGIQQIGAADHIRHALRGIVYNYRQLISENAVRPQHYKIVTVIHTDPPAQGLTWLLHAIAASARIHTAAKRTSGTTAR